MPSALKSDIALTDSILVDKVEYRILELNAEGYTVPYIHHKLEKEFGFVSKDSIEKFMSRFAEQKLELENPYWEGNKNKFHLNVRLANWFNTLYSKERARVIYTSMDVRTKYFSDGSKIREAVREFRVLQKIESMLTNYRRPRGRGPYEEIPNFKIWAENLNDPTAPCDAYVEPGELTDYLYMAKYVFPGTLLPGDRIRLRSTQELGDWYGRTQHENNIQWKNTPTNNISFATVESRDHQTVWHDYNVRGMMNVRVQFCEEFPAKWPELRLYSTAWARDKTLEFTHLSLGNFQVNGNPHAEYKGGPVFDLKFCAHGLPPCKVAFFWKPYVAR